jgi:hypothetical protein
MAYRKDVLDFLEVTTIATFRFQEAPCFQAASATVARLCGLFNYSPANIFLIALLMHAASRRITNSKPSLEMRVTYLLEPCFWLELAMASRLSRFVDRRGTRFGSQRDLVHWFVWSRDNLVNEVGEGVFYPCIIIIGLFSTVLAMISFGGGGDICRIAFRW